MEMADLYTKVGDTSVNRCLVKPGDKILVAISGGADSVALLLMLQHLGYKCEAVHCNFNLRGKESDRDENFVRDLCKAKNVRLHYASFDTLDYASDKGISIEMAARELRYDFFERCFLRGGYSAIAVAHHRDDNVETLLLNLIRGTGLKGLTGMRYRNGNIIRPLLDVRRCDLEQFLRMQGQVYVTDSSNNVADVTRNKIRLQLLPWLREINPSIDDSIQSTISFLSDSYTLYRNAIDNEIAKITDSTGVYSLERLADSKTPETVLYEILSEYGFNRMQISEIWEQRSGIAGKVYESFGWRALRNRGCLLLRKKDDVIKILCKLIPFDGIVEATNYYSLKISCLDIDGNFDIPRKKNMLCVDFDKLKYPLVLRHIEDGDRFRPFGMKGSKLVSDFLTNLKKSVFEKEDQLVLCSGDDIVWLVGERSDERFRIDDRTSKVLMVEVFDHRI